MKNQIERILFLYKGQEEYPEEFDQMQIESLMACLEFLNDIDCSLFGLTMSCNGTLGALWRKDEDNLLSIHFLKRNEFTYVYKKGGYKQIGSYKSIKKLIELTKSIENE